MAESDRKRKVKFTDRELQVLIEEMQRYLYRLNSRNLREAEKSRIWECLYQSVSALGVCKSSPPECKRRWHDLKRRTKEKISFNQNQASASGREPPQEQPLTDFEEIVQQTLQLEQVVGLEGIDTGACISQEYQGIYIKKMPVSIYSCAQHFLAKTNFLWDNKVYLILSNLRWSDARPIQYSGHPSGWHHPKSHFDAHLESRSNSTPICLCKCRGDWPSSLHWAAKTINGPRTIFCINEDQ